MATIAVRSRSLIGRRTGALIGPGFRVAQEVPAAAGSIHIRSARRGGRPRIRGGSTSALVGSPRSTGAIDAPPKTAPLPRARRGRAPR